MPILKDDLFEEFPLLAVPGMLGELAGYRDYGKWNEWRQHDWYDAYNAMQHQKLRAQLSVRDGRPPKTRATWKDIKAMLTSELEGRLRIYKNPDMRNKLLCVVGDSGVGKTLATLHLQNKKKANVICSYTTRRPRFTEREGREHHFIDIIPPEEQLLACAVFDGARYYATRAQVWGDVTVYVVDEAGLADLRERWGDTYDIVSLYIVRSRRLRSLAGVGAARVARDNGRCRLPLESYDYVIENSGTKRDFFAKVEAVYDEVLKGGRDE